MKITIKLEAQSASVSRPGKKGKELSVTWRELADLFFDALNGAGFLVTAQDLAEHYGESS